MTGLGFFDERVQFSGAGVHCNFLIPKRFAVFQQPISHSMNIPGFKLCDCGFNFLHSTHGGKVSDWCADDKSANGARGKEGVRVKSLWLRRFKRPSRMPTRECSGRASAVGSRSTAFSGRPSPLSAQNCPGPWLLRIPAVLSVCQVPYLSSTTRLPPITRQSDWGWWRDRIHGNSATAFWSASTLIGCSKTPTWDCPR